MRLVVTGATGFVGSHFVERALQKGHQVTGISNSNGAGKRELRAALIAHGAKLVAGDVMNPSSLQAAMSGADCVCHFAAAFREGGMPDEFFMKLNAEGTANVMNAAAAAGVRRFVLCSTAGIYGQRVRGVIDESFPQNPWNAYERSKIESERIVRERSAELGMEYVILRPTAVYGPRDQRLLKLFKSAAKGRFPLFGAGTGRRHMVYVTDLADAFVRACTMPEAASQELIIAGPAAVPLWQMLQELALVVKRPRCGPQLPLRPMQWVSAVVEDVSKLLHVNPPLYRRRMDFYINDASFSTARAQRVLGWRPKVALSEGLALTFNAYNGTAERSPATTPPMSGRTRQGVEVRDSTAS